MRRVAAFLVRNWPLKVGALVLATALYSGLVLGQSARTWTGVLPISASDGPTDATLISELPPVHFIRYRAPLDVAVISPDLFEAKIDLSDVDARPGGLPADVAVTVESVDRRIQVIDFEPRIVEVRLDPIQERELNITVDHGVPPAGLNVGPPQVDPSVATILGGSSRVAQVSEVEARVTIDASALNIDREVNLVPIDVNGNQVPGVEISPTRARVRIAIARELATRTLPVVPQLVGQPAPGYRITSVTVDPLIITVSGEEATITQLETATTEPIDVSGRTRDVEALVRFGLPDGVSVSGGDTVRVVVTIAEETGSRTFQVGVVLSGEVPENQYLVTPQQVNVTLGGTIAALDAIDATQLIATVNVSATPGDALVTVVFVPSPGLEVLAISPDQVRVIAVTLVSPSPPPSPGPSP